MSLLRSSFQRHFIFRLVGALYFGIFTLVRLTQVAQYKAIHRSIIQQEKRRHKNSNIGVSCKKVLTRGHRGRSTLLSHVDRSGETIRRGFRGYPSDKGKKLFRPDDIVDVRESSKIPEFFKKLPLSGAGKHHNFQVTL